MITLLPSDFPRINIGYIHEINDRIALGGDIGIGFEGHIDKENYSLWEVRPQLIYTIKKRKRFQHFLLLETFYIYNEETRFDVEFEPIDNQGGTIEQINYERADFTRVKYGFTLNYGEYINLLNRLGLRTNLG